MALNLRRWVLAAVAGCALILLAYRPGEEEARPAWWDDRFALPTPEQRHLNELGSALQRARSELFLAEQRDTLLRGLAIRRPRTRIDSMLADLQAGQGTAGKLLKDPAMYEDFRQTIADIRRLINVDLHKIVDDLNDRSLVRQRRRRRE